MVLTIKDGYALYIKDIENKLTKYNVRLDEVSKEKEYLFGVINSYVNEYSVAGLDIDELVYGNRAKFDIRLVKRYKFDSKIETLLQNYIVSYINLLKIERVCIDLISQYIILKVPYSFYKYVSVELNLEFSKAILLGNVMEIGNGIGNISIFEKKRNGNKSINWVESNKLRQWLLDNNQVPYDAHTAPEGVKWHVYYTDEYSYWWYWKYLSCMESKNVFYKFVPTKFINGVAREIDNFNKNFGTIEKILATTLLGNIDKLYKIIKLDPSHVLYYRRNSDN